MKKRLLSFFCACLLLFTALSSLGTFARSSEYEQMMKLKNEDKRISGDFRSEYDVFINPFESFPICLHSFYIPNRERT